MKTKLLSVALLASAALIMQAQGGPHSSGGGGGSGGHFASGGPARGGGGSSFRAAPGRSFGGGRGIYAGQRFSTMGPRRFDGAVNYRGNSFTRSANPAHLAQARDGFRSRNGSTANRVTGVDRIGRGNNLPSNWRNHVVAQHPAGWQRGWNRGRDHWWHGHHCRFIDGSWVIFDYGFYPWWPYWYPYDYYGYDYYPYSYNDGPDVYGSDFYQGGGDEEQGDAAADDTVAAAQARLANLGYYRGEIDGVFGGEMRRAVARYQSRHGLRVTGALTIDTLQALGVRGIASN